MSRTLNQVAVVWAILSFLCSFYLITYHGLFRSVDELALFSMTESLVQTRSMQTPQLAFARYHNVVGRLEPLHSLLAVPLYWIAVQREWLGNIQTVMLLNVWTTAATGAALYVLLSLLGHPPGRAALAALIYGLATIAWPYSRTFLREPLVALLLLLAAVGLVCAERACPERGHRSVGERVPRRQVRRVGFVALALSCMALALFTKVTSALAWLAFALAFLLQAGLSRRARIRRLLAVLFLGMLGAAVLSAVYVVRRGHGLEQLFARLADWQDLSLVFSRTFGLTFGAGRGLFLFSPVLLLAWPGLVAMWRQKRTVAIGVLGVLAVFVAGYSSYDDWHGGLSWGSRFLVPIVPLLMVPVAESLAVLMRAPARRGWRAMAGLLIAVSLGVQFVASTANNSSQAGKAEWVNLIDYARSPVVQQLLSWRPTGLDMLWWHGPAPVLLKHGYVNGWIPLLPLICAAGSMIWLIAALKRPLSPAEGASPHPRPLSQAWARGEGASPHPNRTLAFGPPYSLLWARGGCQGWASSPGAVFAACGGLGLLLVAAMWVLLWQAPMATPGYPGANPAELRQITRIVNQERDEPHAIVTVSNDFHINVLLNYFKGRFVHHWVSPLQTEGFEELGMPVGAFPPLVAQSLRLIVDRVHMPPDRSGRDAEFWLNARLHRYFVDWIGGGYVVYSFLYPPAEMPLQQMHYRWDHGLTMSAYGMTPQAVVPGEAVWLEFHCAAWKRPDRDYDIFVQFLSPDGSYVNGTDGPPQFGARLTSRWQPGETIIDRRAFFVPGDATPGVYRVIAGFYVNGERQPVYDGTGRPLGTHIELGKIQVKGVGSRK